MSSHWITALVAEPGASMSDGERAVFVFLVVLIHACFLALGGATVALLSLVWESLRGRLQFTLLSLLFAGIYIALGWASMIIPAVMVLIGFVLLGRTM